jgi:predicted transposase YdaD
VKAPLDAALVPRAVVQALEAQGDPAIQELKETAKAEGIAEGVAKGIAEGMAKGIAESVLAVLEARGITVSPERREEILACSDVDRLQQWLREATLPTTTEAAARD